MNFFKTIWSVFSKLTVLGIGSVFGIGVGFGFIILLLLVFALLNWNDISSGLKTLLTIIATLATAWAAYAASRSASVSVKALNITEQTANDTLELTKTSLKESQGANTRSAFEARYTLLLAQHNEYHEKVCSVLDMDVQAKEVMENRFEWDSLHTSLTFLTGHTVISPYMRILYHLLKHIDEDFYEENAKIDEKKKYSSLVRSVIRNDVLFLIAINALNVNSELAKLSGYPKYQKLLHLFDFFEHAVFIHPQKPNDINPSVSLHRINIIGFKEYKNNILNEAKKTEALKHELHFFSSVLVCTCVYENPLKWLVDDAYNSIKLNVISTLKLNAEQRIEDFKNCRSFLENFTGGFYLKPDMDVLPITNDEVTRFINKVKEGDESFKSLIRKTKYYVDESHLERGACIEGAYFLEQLEGYVSTQNFYNCLSGYGELDNFIEVISQNINSSIKQNKDNINTIYNVKLPSL